MSSIGHGQDSDDQEVFEIQDYTTASDWERFTAAIEETLHDWQLNIGERRSGSSDIEFNSLEVEWQEKKDTIKFTDYPFTITYHFLTYKDNETRAVTSESCKDENERDDGENPQYLMDMMNFKNDFPNKVHCLVRWYGLKEFITVVPANSRQPLASPSKARIVLSSLALAANNTNCEVPLFLQINEIQDKVYVGVGIGGDIRTDFEMAYVSNPPPQCTHLSGLLDVFKNKIGTSIASAPVLISIRFTYILREWPHTFWSQQPPDLDAVLSEVGFSELGKLPFGALSDPVSELQVSTTWSCVSEYNMMETDIQSDLNPSSASIWSARLGSAFAPPCLLAEYLSEFLFLCETQRSIVEILGPEFDPAFNDGIDIVNALDRLTASSIPSFPSTSKIRFQSSKKGPLSEEMISLLLNFLFPDAQTVQVESAVYDIQNFSQVSLWKPPVEGLPQEHPLTEVLRKLKSCDVDSFVWRLTIILSHVTHSLGGLSSVAHFLYEVFAELTFRWDNALLIPGLTGGFPDLASCIVNQKLQMLNCCIQRRIKREEIANQSGSSGILDEEEEFFECEETVVEQETESVKDYPSWDKPVGRLKRLGNARLTKRGDYIYIPITQDAAPNTEDMLEEQTGELLRLGADASGSCQRAKLMSASLLSDMESFKAANPGAVIEDFVRWYSPRDWIEEEPNPEYEGEAISGHLSNRMLIPGNLWIEVWENAKPVPARRQKRLFDDTREAEKILGWFTQMTPPELCRELLPVLMHASVCRISEEPILYTLASVNDETLPSTLHDDSLAAQLELITKRVSRLSRQPPKVSQYKTVQYQIETLERTMAKALSLRMKFLGHSEVSSACLRYRREDPSTLVPVEPETVSAIEERVKEREKVSQAASRNLESLSPLESLVSQLLLHSEVTLEGGPKGPQASVIKKLFSDAHNLLYMEDAPPEKKEKLDAPPFQLGANKHEQSRYLELGKPEGREYILRTHAPFPVDHSRVLPQRLYAVILKGSFRMAGAITQDALFC